MTRECHAVGMGEVAFSGQCDLACYALGSCVACVSYARRERLGAIAHIVLPGVAPDPQVAPHRYATNAVDAIIQGFAQRHISPASCDFYLVGGAQILTIAPLVKGRHMGERNVEAVTVELEKNGIHAYRADTGGKTGRTVRLDILTGHVSVSRMGGGEVVL